MPVPQLPAIPPAPTKPQIEGKKSSTAPLTKIPKGAVTMPLISAPTPEATTLESQGSPPVEPKPALNNVHRDPLKPVQP